MVGRLFDQARDAALAEGPDDGILQIERIEQDIEKIGGEAGQRSTARAHLIEFFHQLAHQAQAYRGIRVAVNLALQTRLCWRKVHQKFVAPLRVVQIVEFRAQAAYAGKIGRLQFRLQRRKLHIVEIGAGHLDAAQGGIA